MLHSLYKTEREEVLYMFRAMRREIGTGIFSDNLEHGRCGLKVVPGRMTLEHLHYCRTNAPAEG